MSNDEPKSLRDVARAALDRHKGVSGRQLAEIARGKGLTIVSTTINHMAAGTYTSRPTAKTLDALAELSGLSREVVYRVADQPLALAPLRDALPPDADLLDGPQREAVLAVIRQFAAAQRALHGSEEVGSDAGSSAAIKPAGEDRVTNLGSRRKGESKLSSIKDPYEVAGAAANDPDDEGKGGRSNEDDH